MTNLEAIARLAGVTPKTALEVIAQLANVADDNQTTLRGLAIALDGTASLRAQQRAEQKPLIKEK